ncbi:MAG: gamma-glutamylcyclotransferase [Burkholderiaceae bacterium]
MVLSRDQLKNDYVKKLAEANCGSNQPKPLSHEELADSLNKTMAQTKTPNEVWVFGYGSLIWNPLFQFDQFELATLYGYRRRFCLKTEISRGTPDCPGLILGLEPGGSCRGLAYKMATQNLAEDLSLMWRREMLTGAYSPRWVRLKTRDTNINALAFVMNRDYPFYARGLSDDQTAQVLANASGPLGSCEEYLTKTHAGLVSHNIVDAHMNTLIKKVRLINQNKSEKQ